MILVLLTCCCLIFSYYSNDKSEKEFSMLAGALSSTVSLRKMLCCMSIVFCLIFNMLWFFNCESSSILTYFIFLGFQTYAFHNLINILYFASMILFFDLQLQSAKKLSDDKILTEWQKVIKENYDQIILFNPDHEQVPE